MFVPCRIPSIEAPAVFVFDEHKRIQKGFFNSYRWYVLYCVVRLKIAKIAKSFQAIDETTFSTLAHVEITCPTTLKI